MVLDSHDHMQRLEFLQSIEMTLNNKCEVCGKPSLLVKGKCSDCFWATKE